MSDPALKEKTIYGNRLLVWRNIHLNEPQTTNLWALLKTDEFSGRETVLHDWKSDKDAGTIYVRGEVYLGNGQYFKFENTFACLCETVPVKPPGRNFQWNPTSGNWRNVKTGERRTAF